MPNIRGMYSAVLFSAVGAVLLCCSQMPAGAETTAPATAKGPPGAGSPDPDYRFGPEDRGDRRYGRRGPGRRANVVIVDGRARDRRGRARTIQEGLDKVRPGGTVVIQARPRGESDDYRYEESIVVTKPVTLIGDGARRDSYLKRPVLTPPDGEPCLVVRTSGKVIIRDIDFKVREFEDEESSQPCVRAERGHIEFENNFIAGRDTGAALMIGPEVTEALIRKNEIAHAQEGVRVLVGTNRRSRRFDRERTYRIEVNDIYGNDIGLWITGQEYAYLPDHLVKVSIFDNTIVENGSYSSAFEYEDGGDDRLEPGAAGRDDEPGTGEDDYDEYASEAPSQKAAIILEGLVTPTVSGNQVIRNTGYGLLLRDTAGVFENNQVSDNGLGGFLVLSPPVQTERDVRPVFSGNTITLNGRQSRRRSYGIEIGLYGALELDVNSFRGNRCGCVGPPPAFDDPVTLRGRGVEEAARCQFLPHSDEDWERYNSGGGGLFRRRPTLTFRCNEEGRLNIPEEDLPAQPPAQE